MWSDPYFWVGLFGGAWAMFALAEGVPWLVRVIIAWWVHRGPDAVYRESLVELRMSIPWHTEPGDIPRILRDAAETAERYEREGPSA